MQYSVVYIMPVCPKCSNPVESTVKFCPNCGQKVSTQDGSGPSPAPAGEIVVGVITGLELKRSIFKSDPVNLVVTGTRTLCVPVAALMETAVRQAENEAKSEGKWFLGRIKAKFEVTKACDFTANFRNRSPDDILKEYPASIVVPHSDLATITIHHRNLDFEGDESTTTVEDWSVVLKTRTGEYKLLAKVDPLPQFRLNTEINTIFGDRIRVV